MKVFAFIMSFIVLGVSCLPCPDVDALTINNTNLTEISFQLSTEQGDTHMDFCNPFCTCSCCGVTSITPVLTGATLELPQYFTFYEDNYSSSTPISIPKPIWQPPKLWA